MTENMESKAWDWSLVPTDSWNEVSDDFLPVALRWKKLQKRTVLDLGCGRGRHSIFLAETGFEITAVDLSPAEIDQLRKQAQQKNLDRNIETLVCDMRELPFSKRTFDCVLAYNSIYLTSYDGLKTTIASITDLLTDSGQVYITFVSKSGGALTNPAHKVIDDFTIIKTQGTEKGMHHTYLDYSDILKLMSDYQILKIQHIQGFSTSGANFRYFVEAAKK